MRKFFFAASLATALPAYAFETPAFIQRATQAVESGNQNVTDDIDEHRRSKQNFADAFPRAFYKKRSFGITVTGASIVGAGVISYFSGGTGAPAAASSVSTVASWIAGGGQGAYMAGLSTVGGWFGGNAILGGAILNGIPLGLGGGGAAFATLSTLGKAGVVLGVTATALDGVAYFAAPDTDKLRIQVRLALPEPFCGAHLKELCKHAAAIESGWRKAENEYDVAALEARHRVFVEAIKAMLADDSIQQWSSDEQIALAVLAHQIGEREAFDSILRDIPDTAPGAGGYLHYLRAVSSIENGETDEAMAELELARATEPYALEPTLLLINLLSHKDFAANEARILLLAQQASERFDSDAYETPYSKLSLNFRLGTLHYQHGQYAEAVDDYRRACHDLSLLQKYLLDKPIRSEIQLAEANALYGQGKTEEAAALISRLIDSVDGNEAKRQLKSRYAGTL